MPDGTTPEPPDTAYVQIIRGTPACELTTDELIYDRLNPRTNSPYGLGTLESLIITVSAALKSDQFNLAYLTEGNVPEGFIMLPEEIANSTEQVKTWQDYFDALVAGDPRYQRRIKALPAGATYVPTKEHGDMSFEKFSEWLMEVTCAVFGVPPQDLGFTAHTNRATSKTQQEIGEEKGTAVYSLFLKEIYDRIVQQDLGFRNLQFIWSNLNPADKEQEAKVLDLKIRNGTLSIDEARNIEGLDPIGMTNAIITPTGPVLIETFLAQQEAALTPAQQQQPTPTGTEPDPNVQQQSGETHPPDTSRDQVSDNNDVPAMDEGQVANMEEQADLIKWRRVILKAVKEGKTNFKDFESDVIHPALMDRINYELNYVTTPESARKVFDKYLQPEGLMLRGALKLNAELNQIANSQPSTS